VAAVAGLPSGTKRSSISWGHTQELYNYNGFLSSGRGKPAYYGRLLVIAGDIEVNPGPAIRTLQWNCQGLRNKISELRKWCADNLIDVIALQEVQFPDSEVLRIPGFDDPILTRRKVGRTTNTTIKGGDVAIFVKEGLKYSSIKQVPLHPDDKTTEWVGVTIYPDEKNGINIHNLYIPPIRTRARDARVNKFYPDHLPTSKCIILGDMNGHHPSWDDQCEEADDIGKKIDEWVTDNNVQIANSGEPTHIHQGTGNISSPDVTIVADNLIPFLEWSIAEDLGSDHTPIILDLTTKTSQTGRGRTKWSFRKAKWEAFEKDIEDSLEAKPVSTEHPGAMERKLIEVILKSAQQNIPRGARKNPKPWWTDEVDKAVKLRRDTRKRANIDDEGKDRWLEAAQKAR